RPCSQLSSLTLCADVPEVPLLHFPSLFSYSPRLPPSPSSFPTRRSSDLHLHRRHSRLHDHLHFEVLEVTLPSAGVALGAAVGAQDRKSTSELQSRFDLVCRLLREKKKRRSRFGRRCTASRRLRRVPSVTS